VRGQGADVRVAVIGTGNIGSTLGAALARGGHEVVLGSRHPDDGTPPDGTSVTGLAEALAGAEAVLLALPARAVEGFLADHAAALRGVLVVDATNNVGAPVANAYRAIADAVPDVRYARAFNALGWENFADPDFDGGPADLFFATADAADRAATEELISAVGLRPAYLGAGKQDAVDHALPLWFALAQERGNRHVAFRVLEK
jgi:predicted dinucleotide-binding enzyme